MSDFTTTMLILGVILGGLGAVLGGLSVVLHAIAPHTKTTIDDTAAADLDQVHAKLDALTALLKKLAPPAAIALLLLGLGASQLGCATVRTEASAAKTAIVDCVHADQAPIEALIVQLGADAVTFALHGDVDWGALEQAAERQGAVVGGCAFALFAGHPWPAPSSSTGVAVSALMTPPPAPDPRAAALERLRAGFGGVRWQTSAGVL